MEGSAGKTGSAATPPRRPRIPPVPRRPTHPAPPRPEALETADPAVSRKAPRGHELGDAQDLRPIGKARLKALREAIRSGTYPSNEFVEQGLFRMFSRPASRRPRG